MDTQPQTEQITQIKKRQKSTHTITIRIDKQDRKNIELLKSHYRHTHISSAIKLALSDMAEEIRKKKAKTIENTEWKNTFAELLIPTPNETTK